jgi:hypothetical protein
MHLRRHGFVLFSIEASVRALRHSVFAWAETAAAVAIYWWIALHFDTQRHLWISICVAPLLLLRSKDSIALGVRRFTAYAERNDPFENMTGAELPYMFRFWAIIGLSALASGSIFYWVARYWFIDYYRWPLFGPLSALIGWISLRQEGEMEREGTPWPLP